MRLDTLNGHRSVAQGVFFGGAHLGKSLGVTFGKEYRIIAEAIAASWTFDDDSLQESFSHDSNVVWRDKDQHTPKPRRTPTKWNAAEI